MSAPELPECCTRYADHVFVFGSNEAGRHGAGAALHAVQHHAAERGNGFGAQQWNGYIKVRSWAIPTKDARLRPLPLTRIAAYVGGLLAHARSLPERRFYVTRIGCGLAGYTDADIAPMFANAPNNCVLPDGWRNYNAG